MAKATTPEVGEKLRGYGRDACNFYALAERLKAHTDWHMGAMWAEHAYGPRYLGELPPMFDRSVHRADYIVYSWQTPIAWFLPGGETGWVVPDVKYSQTTTVHQGRIRVALSVIDKV